MKEVKPRKPMKREELLTKLAMELAEWPSQKTSKYQITYQLPNPFTWSKGSSGPYRIYTIGGTCQITRDDYHAERTRLIAKPSWADAPEWAQWLAQDEDGEWSWFADEPQIDWDQWGRETLTDEYELALGGAIPAGHDWRTTLEKRPVDEAPTPDEEEAWRTMDRQHAAYIREIDRQFAADMHAVVVKSAWNGEGLPPEGTKCELLWESDGAEYVQAVYMGKTTSGTGIFEILTGEDAGLIHEDALQAYTNGLPNIRPIRTEVEREIEALAEAIRPLGHLTLIEKARRLFAQGYRKAPQEPHP